MARSVRKFKETMEIRENLFQRVRSHRMFSIGLVSIALLLAACLHIWQRVMVIELAKDVALLNDENRSLVDEIKKVRSDIVALSTVTRLEQYAADSLKLRPPTADRLFTLVTKSEKAISSSELQEMFSSIKRVADYLPVLTDAQASAGRELQPIKFDSLTGGEAIK